MYIEASYDHDQSKNQKVVHEKAASVLEKQIPQEDLEQMIRNIEFVVTGVQKRPTTEEAKNQFIGQLLDVLEHVRLTMTLRATLASRLQSLRQKVAVKEFVL